MKDENISPALQAARELLTQDPASAVWLAMVDTADYINYSTIARQYFHRTPNWLTQRLRGNIVNGRPARLTPAQVHQLADALRDITTRLHRAADALDASLTPQ